MGIKYKVNEDFFITWSRNMAYVLGFICADGSMEDASYLRGKYIRISSTDLDIIEKIKEALDSFHKIIIIKPQNNRHKIKYLLRIGSHKIFNSLLDLGIHPKKSLNLDFPKVPPKYTPDFIRGYFDGDGCVYLEKDKELKIKRVRIVFTSGSLLFLKGLEKNIRKNIKTTLKPIYKSHRSFQLSYSTKESKSLFDLMYKKSYDKLHLERKFNKFKEVF